jgi:polyhydroxybutyrate depolymerase
VRTRPLNTVAHVLAVLITASVAVLVAGCGAGGGGGDSSGGGSGGGSAGGPSTAPPVGPRLQPIIYRPANLPRSRKVPLLIALPGVGGTPHNMQRGTRFDRLADMHGFVVAYLASADRARPWRPAAWPQDLRYISSMIDRLKLRDNVDPKRVYVVGFSNGGAFTFVVGCRLSSKIAAIVPVSAIMNTKLDVPCAISHPVSELSIIGNADGRFNGLGGYTLSADQVAATWRAKNGCQAGQPARVSQVGSAIEKTWGPCAAGSAVGLYVVQGGTHIYPGDPSFNLPPSNPDAQFDASPAIWAFLSALPAQ